MDQCEMKNRQGSEVLALANKPDARLAVPYNCIITQRRVNVKQLQVKI
jgi:hypothetical protein